MAAASETRALELGPGALMAVPRLFELAFPGKSAVVAADPRTFHAAGLRVLDSFRKVGRAATEFLYTDPGLSADYKHMLALEEVLRARPGAIPVAVGSGTINDLAKLAAHRTNRRYLAVATAASMDGYTAFGASINYQGAKQTFPCPAPLVVVADLEVIGAAPAELNAAGYADLAAKLTAGADWLLADALGVEPLHSAAWAMAQDSLREALADPAGVRQGQPGAIRRLIEGLMLTGFAMQAAGSSRPASGAEHQFSHVWDMQGHTYAGKTPLHGFKVGIGSLAATALYEYVLSQPLAERKVDPWCPWWPDDAERENVVRRLFEPGEPAAVASRESAAKATARSVVRAQLDSLRHRWPGLCHKLRQQLVPLAQLKEMLQAAGAPAEPEQIGISREQLRQTYRQAYFIRRRFTILDLVFRANLFEGGLEHLFGSDGPWPLTCRAT